MTILWRYIYNNMRFAVFDFAMGLTITATRRGFSAMHFEGFTITGYAAEPANIEIVVSALRLIKDAHPFYFDRLKRVGHTMLIGPSPVVGRSLPISKIIEINPQMLNKGYSTSEVILITAGILVHESAHCAIARKLGPDLNKFYCRVESSCNRAVMRFSRSIKAQSFDWLDHFPVSGDVHRSRKAHKSSLSLVQRFRAMIARL